MTSKSSAGTQARLDYLKHLLVHLPSELPERSSPQSIYSSFLNFHLNQDYLEKTGDEVAALGEQLEHIFGWKSRTTGDGILPILERGPAISALHSILQDFYKKYPSSAILVKWIDDVVAGAEKVYERFLEKIPEFLATDTNQSGKLAKRPRSDSSQATITQLPKQMKLSSSGDKSSPSIKSGRGRKPNPLMEKLVRKEYGADGKVLQWYCIATGCTHHGSNAPALARVLKHSTECLLLKNESPDLYEQACQEPAENSLSSQLDQSLLVGSSSKSLNTTGQQRLDVVALKKAGKKRKEEELENLRLVVDLIIVWLICT